MSFTQEAVVGIVIGVLALIFLWMSYMHFREKGYLFNNAYIYAPRIYREKMNKKPYYRQSAIVFLLLGVAFLCLAFHLILSMEWLLIVEVGLLAATIVYAIVSFVYIRKHE